MSIEDKNEPAARQWVENGTIAINSGHENLVERGLMVVEFDDGSTGLWPAVKTQADIEYLYARHWLILRKHVRKLWMNSADLSEYNKAAFAGERIILAGEGSIFGQRTARVGG